MDCFCVYDYIIVINPFLIHFLYRKIMLSQLLHIHFIKIYHGERVSFGGAPYKILNNTISMSVSHKLIVQFRPWVKYDYGEGGFRGGAKREIGNVNFMKNVDKNKVAGEGGGQIVRRVFSHDTLPWDLACVPWNL